jgi:restriction system protein
MVRAGEGAYLIDDFKEKNYVAIGWNELGNINNISSKAELKELIKEKELYRKESQINTAAGQLYRFVFEIKKGDYVISYDPNNRFYLVGEVLTDCIYDKKIGEYHKYRKVEWKGTVNRDDLKPSTKNTLGAISTIFSINENAATEIIKLLKGEVVVEEIEQEDIEDIKEDMVFRASELIMDKLINLDWEEMEKLVAGILRGMGYKTFITERVDRGKDIGASPDGLLLEDPRILVEVKHRKGKMGAEAIRGFITLLKSGRKGLYISTGGFSKEAKYEAERSNEQLTLIDANKLVQLIIENYDNFDVDTKLLIPLTKIYWPI